MISRDKKETIVASTKARLAASQALLIAENGGLSVAEMTTFREELKSQGGQAQIVKNTLVKLAMEGSPYSPLGESLSGPLIFGTSEDPATLAKVFSNTAKGNEKFIIRGGALAEGLILNPADVGRLAAIPGRHQLMGMLVTTMAAPISGFMRTLNEVPSGFVRVLAAVLAQKTDKDA